MANYCTKCGTELIDGICPKCTQEQNTGNKQDEKFKRFFMNPKEKLVTTLGNTYIQNFLSGGSLEKGFAVVSEKRMYFQGTAYELVPKSNGRKKLVKTQKSRIVDLKDVTGSGYDNHKFLGFLICAIAFFVISAIIIFPAMMNLPDGGAIIMLSLFFFIIPGLIFLSAYYKTQINLIAIQFAGGEIAFDISWFPEKEIADFQKQLRLAKDKAVEEADNAVACKLQEAVSSATSGQQTQQVTSVADELAKYGDLLEKGLITQEEFDKKKKELL